MSQQVGIDLVYIPRFKAMQEQEPQMTQRMFTSKELSTHTTIKNLAGIYAAKEAIMKAISPETLSLHDVEIGHTVNGKPTVICKILEKKFHFNLSISHDGEYAVAICIAEIV